MLKRIILFLVITFGGLALGSLFTTEGASSTWYEALPKAPWTPPGWVFGVAWTFIMVCFSLYMALLSEKVKNKKQLIILFTIQWILNVSWNPVFFYFHKIAMGLLVITALLVIIHVFLFRYYKILAWRSLLILPYAIWLWIATSLNAYIYWFHP
ncbi:tryptophan-rich sensory protein [Aureisphaera sp. CAU 1614]|uniref:Tryptophan-rich sensory protein n=1 Tax=Halomarinibacterium sedimenti TaxID=2857106 RepID=A0A9X1FLG0_9FLAO|nr:TspO/MBR family protein [Halomarinibacterium sedimenti]MBW2936487.1 tryptophan-rich sensory protein [Halomarinibacterium sedimenti]